MNKLFYPAIFHSTEDNGFWVSFPDFPECLTEGDNIEQAYEMAFNCLGLGIVSREKEGVEIPLPSTPPSINLNDNEFLAIIEFDLNSYRKKNSSKSVKKTLTIPEWLNEEAVAMNINFSQVLQDALMQKINRQ